MIPCVCGHEKDNHFEIQFYDRKSDWACRNVSDCWCIDYKPISNLKWLEMNYEEKLKK